MSTPLPTPSLSVGALVDDPSALPEPRPPLIKRMCMRCELVLGWTVGGPGQGGQVSHGLCEVCYAVQMEELLCTQPVVKLSVSSL
jgi:hypothetical protein